MRSRRRYFLSKPSLWHYFTPSTKSHEEKLFDRVMIGDDSASAEYIQMLEQQKNTPAPSNKPRMTWAEYFKDAPESNYVPYVYTPPKVTEKTIIIERPAIPEHAGWEEDFLNSRPRNLIQESIDRDEIEQRHNEQMREMRRLTQLMEKSNRLQACYRQKPSNLNLPLSALSVESGQDQFDFILGTPQAKHIQKAI